MQGITHWNFSPMYRFDQPETALLPTVCALQPEEDGFRYQYLDNGCDGPHRLLLRKRGEASWETLPDTGSVMGLEPLTDYEMQIVRTDGTGESLVRLVRTGKMPGDTVINYLHPDDRAYAFSGNFTCSPCITRVPSGDLIATMDIFGPGAPQNLTLVFVSHDGGVSWQYRTELYPSFWPSSFVHNGSLYVLSVSREYGDIQIGRSDDEGRTWTRPSILAPGAIFLSRGFHRNPVPIVRHNGRIWTTTEFGSWGTKCHAAGLMSAPEDSDLLDPASWTFSDFLTFDSTDFGAPTDCLGGIEGNLYFSPEGRLFVLYRLATPSRGGCTPQLLTEGDPENPGKMLRPVKLLEPPFGSNSKAFIQYDGSTGMYLCIANEPTEEKYYARSQRTVISLFSSPDGISWTLRHRIFDYRKEDPERVGLQYPAWAFDGDDLLLVTRVAYNNAENFHNSNCITFHRIKNYKQYL